MFLFRGFSFRFDTWITRNPKPSNPIRPRFAVCFSTMDEERPSRGGAFWQTIAQRKDRKKVRREIEERYRMLVERAPVAIVVHVDEVIIYANAVAVAALGGAVPYDLVGRSIWDFIDQAYRQTVAERIETLRQEQSTVPVTEEKLVRLDGERIDVEVMGTQVLYEGRPAVQAFFHDITKRKQAEEALQQSETRYRLLMEESPFGIQAFAMDGTLVQVNKTWETMWGVRAEEVVGRYNVFADPQLETLGMKCFIERAFAGEAVTVQDTLFDPDRSGMPGRERWVRAHCYHIRDKNGRLEHVVLLSEDITERKQNEQEREALIAELEAKNAELERFTYTVSHDLKSPLITIKGFLSLLEKDALGGNIERMKQDIGQIYRAAAKMQQLLEDLLELSRIGRLTNAPERASLTDLAHEAATHTARQRDQRGIALTIAPTMPTVYGDRARLRQIFQHLLDNAVKFMGEQPEPRIEIDAAVRDAEVICSVHDNGMGIDPKYHEKIFGLFEQLHQQAGGTGIGLTLVKRIVDVHGGRIEVASEGEGCGCTFTFSLPVK